MKALIRKKNELITERFEVPWVDWNTGAPLTNPKWYGGPYTLIENYDPVEFELSARGSGERHFNEETVVIDGKEYTRAELLAILNQTH